MCTSNLYSVECQICLNIFVSWLLSLCAGSLVSGLSSLRSYFSSFWWEDWGRGGGLSTSSVSGRQREKQAASWAGSLMLGLIPGSWDHDLSQRQILNWLSHPGTLFSAGFKGDCFVFCLLVEKQKSVIMLKSPGKALEISY